MAQLNGLLVAKFYHANAKDLLVFGSLRKAFRKPINSVLTRYGELEGEATFRGKLYDLGMAPGAVLSDGHQRGSGESCTA